MRGPTFFRSSAAASDCWRARRCPIDAGAKLTGRIGRSDVGVLAVRTGELRDVVEAKSLVVARIKWNLFQQSYAGVVFTGGRSGLRTVGPDIRRRPAADDVPLPGRVAQPRPDRLRRQERREGRPGQDWSYGFSVRYPNDKYDAQVVLREIQANFDPALGFVQRDNVRLLRLAASYNPRPKDFLNVQQMFHDVFYTRFTRLDNGQVESWDLYVTLLDWHFNSGDNVHGLLDLNPRYERLFEPFEISPGVVLPPGEYRFTRFRSNLLSTAAKRRLSGSFGVSWGHYWSGKAEELRGGLTYKLPPGSRSA